VLNGIAYDPKEKRLFVTGKLWPKLFEIEIVPLQDRSGKTKP
jgi:glutaminyl-peptide cyclotransferase